MKFLSINNMQRRDLKKKTTTTSVRSLVKVVSILLIGTCHYELSTFHTSSTSPCCFATAALMTSLSMKKSSGSSSNKGPLRSKPQGFASALRDLQLASFPYAGTIRPGKQTPQRIVTHSNILKPDYADDGIVRCFLVDVVVTVVVSQG
jgi:hypothetical protein